MNSTAKHDQTYKARRAAARMRWLQKNPDWLRQYYQRNKVRIRARAKAWREDNIERARQHDRNRIHRLRQEALDAYGRQCVCCNEKTEAFLTLDHFTEDKGKRINWKGTTFYFLRGGREYARLKKLNWPPIVRVLCMNCNWACRRNKVCPHQTAREAK